MVAHQAHNLTLVGSTPAPASTPKRTICGLLGALFECRRRQMSDGRPCLGSSRLIPAARRIARRTATSAN